MAITLDGTSGITTSGSLTTSSSLTTGTGAIYNGIQASTAVASTSGTSITFTSIPSWVKRITLMFQGVSTSGTSNLLIQLGSGSVVTTGYNSVGGQFFSGSPYTNVATSTSGFIINQNSATNTLYGTYVFTLISSNIWIGSSSANTFAGTAYGLTSSGASPTLSGALDRVVLTTVIGTDTFDAGSVNILYE